MGTGLKRIKEICKKENAPYPKVEYNENYFYVDFRQSKEYLMIAEREKLKIELLDTLNKRQKIALEVIKKNGRLTIKEFSEICSDVNRRTLTRDMNQLIEFGLIKRMGKGKRDLYYVST